MRAYLITTFMAECLIKIVKKLLKQVYIYIHSLFDCTDHTCSVNDMDEASREEIFKLCREA